MGSTIGFFAPLTILLIGLFTWLALETDKPWYHGVLLVIGVYIVTGLLMALMLGGANIGHSVEVWLTQ